MAHAQKPDFVFRRNGRVHLNRRGRQFSRLLAAEVCASTVVMLDVPCSDVVWRVLATHSIRQFPLQFPSRASPCAITFQLESAAVLLPNESWRNFIISRCGFVKAVSTPRSSINFWRPRSASALDTDDRHAATNSCGVIAFNVGSLFGRIYDM